MKPSIFLLSLLCWAEQLYDDASIVNEASSITSHTIADDLGQPCHRWGICNFNLQAGLPPAACLTVSAAAQSALPTIQPGQAVKLARAAPPAPIHLVKEGEEGTRWMTRGCFSCTIIMINCTRSILPCSNAKEAIGEPDYKRKIPGRGHPANH